jgi:hypothetical protein
MAGGATRGLIGVLSPLGAGPRPITEGEYAGTLRMPLDEAETLLWQWGLLRCPLARERLPLDSSSATIDPPDGSWDSEGPAR